PLGGKIHLLQGVAVEAIARARDFRGLRGVARRQRIALRTVVAPVVLHGRIEGPGLEWPSSERGEQIRSMVGAQRRILRQSDFLIAEVVALADRRAERFLAARGQKTRGDRRGELVGVAEAIAAVETVLAEQLRKGEV